MRRYRSRRRFDLDPITDRARPIGRQKAAKLPTAILFAGISGIAPLAYFFDRFIGGGWHVSILAAIAIAGFSPLTPSCLSVDAAAKAG